MAKIIKMTPEIIREAVEAFRESIGKQKMTDGKITFTKTLEAVSRKATVIFTEGAWFKMQMLITSMDKEIAWHGVARRGDDPEKDEYIISDILVYPQTVTGATVNTDQAEYEKWLNDLDDETFNNLRMQGHSHVNMGVTPSSVDLNLYEEFLERLRDDMFYIFLIYNKKGEKTYKIYDMKKNMLFETADVTVEVRETGLGLLRTLTDMKEKVKTTAVTTPAYPYTGTTTDYSRSGGYGRGAGAGYTGYTATGAASGAYGSKGGKSGGTQYLPQKKDKKKSKPTSIYDDYDDWADGDYYGGYYGGFNSGVKKDPGI